MCGILHDLGKIVMAHIMPEVFEMVIKVAQHEKFLFESENLLSTIGHQQLGKILFENWNMSDIVLDVVSLHNQPLNLENETNKKILYIVHLADSTINLLFMDFLDVIIYLLLNQRFGIFWGLIIQCTRVTLRI